MSAHHKWKLLAFPAVLVVAILVWTPLGDLLFSMRLASSLRKLTSVPLSQDPSIKETKIQHQKGARIYESLTYHPAKSPAATAVILVAGISELGCYHPMLVTLSRHLAEMGLMVITPDIKEFRDFQITAAPVDQILFWYAQVKSLEGGEKVKKIGLAGISFSGTLALMTAARPEVRDTVSFVVAIGPYYNLLRCSRNWFAPETESPRHEGYPSKFYARWIVMRSALDMISDARDRIFLNIVLENLLLQDKTQPPAFDLTPEGLRWFELATSREGPTDTELARTICVHLIARIYPQLDLKEALAGVRCPIFLIHGAYDELIPPEESLEINRHIPSSHLLISPFLTHTHPNTIPLSPKQKVAAVFDALSFCYRLSRSVR